MIGSYNTSNRIDEWELLKQAVLDFGRAGDRTLQLVARTQANMCECMNFIRNFEEFSNSIWRSGVDLELLGNDAKSLESNGIELNTRSDGKLNQQQEIYVRDCIVDGMRMGLFDMTFDLCESVLLLLNDEAKEILKSNILPSLSMRIGR